MLPHDHTTTTLDRLEAGAGREIALGGKQHLFFGGTAYLGLNTCKPFLELFKEGVDRFGINNGNSRGNNVQLAIYADAESVAAERFGSADAIVVSSGFLAAQLTAQHLAAQYDEVCYAPNSHPALWVAGKPDEVGVEFLIWQNQLVDHINVSNKRSFLIVSNTLDPLLPQRYDFSVFHRIRPEKHIHFLLDDSHGIGVLGSLGVPNQTYRVPRGAHIRLTVVASMAKGLGLDAGLVLSDADTLAGLRNAAAYRGASPPAPAAMYAFVKGASIYKVQQNRLQENIHLFIEGIKAAELQYIDQFPVFYSANQLLYKQLLRLGIVISSFAYPSADDPLYNRIVISAAHRPADIHRLLNAMG